MGQLKGDLTFIQQLIKPPPFHEIASHVLPPLSMYMLCFCLHFYLPIFIGIVLM